MRKSSLKFIVIILFLFSLMEMANASRISEENVRIYLDDKDIAHFIITINYEEITTTTFDYLFLGDVYNLNAKFNDKSIICKKKRVEIGTEIVCNKENTTTSGVLELSFYSSNLIREINNVKEITFIKPVLNPLNNLVVSIYLPEGSVLMTLNNLRSFSPENAIIGSDNVGRRIVLKWNLTNVELGKKYVFTAYYEAIVKNQKEDKAFIFFLLLSLGVFLIFLSIGGYFFYKKRTTEKIIEVLIEDEKKVLDIIKKLGDGCKQKDVVKESGFSKAKVSRIIDDLKRRGIIKTERVGRTNKIYLEIK